MSFPEVHPGKLKFWENFWMSFPGFANKGPLRVKFTFVIFEVGSEKNGVSSTSPESGLPILDCFR